MSFDVARARADTPGAESVADAYRFVTELVPTTIGIEKLPPVAVPVASTVPVQSLVV